MIHTNSTFVIDLKNKTNTIKGLLAGIMTISAILGFVYLLFWTGVMSDKYMLELGRAYFEPLASFLNPNDTSVDIYYKTGFMLFAVSIPAMIISYFVDKVEDVLLYIHKKREEQEEFKARQKEYLEGLKQYDIIKTYSICLSVDYEAKRGLSDNAKATLNKIVNENVRNVVKEYAPDAQIYINEVLIIKSANFDNYDNLYNHILKALAKIKSNFEARYDVAFIPSLTTDAYTEEKDTNEIKRNHFEIQSFNFKNRACSTALFSKKYKHLNHKQYAGIPIGEYVAFDENRTGTYELNIIYKNLSNTLASIS